MEFVDEKSATSAAATGPTPASEASEAFLCSTPGCSKPACMACPTCLKLKLPPSRFCDQDCFKSYWNTHKAVHKQAAIKSPELDPLSLPDEFIGYPFSGKLRPCQKSPKRLIPPGIVKPDYADHPRGIPLSEEKDRRTNTTIRKYSPEDLKRIREVCRIGREILDIAGNAVRVGITCDEIDAIVHQATVGI